MKLIHKGETISKLKTKTYFYKQNYEGVDVIGIIRIVLSDRLDGLEDFKILKEYKGKMLLYQKSAFKVSTLVEALSIMFGENKEL